MQEYCTAFMSCIRYLASKRMSFLIEEPQAHLYVARRCHPELGRGCLCSVWKDLLHGLIHWHPN